MKNSYIYLDNAATTFPKPAKVVSEVEDCIRHYCGNPSRGSNPLAMMSAQRVFECRGLLSDMFGCPLENVVFTYNTTYALNMAIKGVLCDGDHLLISDMEHNSVLRPAEQLRLDGKIDYDIFTSYKRTTHEILEDIDRRLRKNTRALCCIHSSNICSYSLPIEAIGKFCRERNIIFICDAAQAAGHADINMRQSNIDILCIPFHKGLYGIQGGGAMLLSESISPRTIIQGGNGVHSLELYMGDMSPEKYEAGTLSVPSVVGLCEGIKFLNTRGIGSIRKQNELLFSQAYRSLSSIPGITLYDDTEGSVLLFGIKGISPDEAGEIFDRFGICLRVGYHCSPLAHKALETTDGGIRISFGAFNTPSQISYLSSITEDISCGKLRV